MSPVPLGEDELEQPSEVRPATAHELRMLKEATQKSYTIKDVWWFLGALAAVVVATAWAQDKVQSKVDAGVSPIGERVTRAELRIEKVEAAQQKAALEDVRQSTMLEMLVVKARMEPPPKVDGGK